MEYAFCYEVVEDLFEEYGEEFMESVEALYVAAVGGQSRKPGGHVVGDIGIYSLNGSVLFDDASRLPSGLYLIRAAGKTFTTVQFY